MSVFFGVDQRKQRFEDRATAAKQVQCDEEEQDLVDRMVVSCMAGHDLPYCIGKGKDLMILDVCDDR